MKFSRLLPSCLALALGTSIASAQDSSALIDTLVRKKILTAQEAEDIRADLIKENTSAQKIKLSGAVTELSLYGDLRLRYQYSNLDPQFDPKAPTNNDLGHGAQGSKLNFRLRLNGDFKLTDNWFGGVQLTTGQNTDTGSQTYDGGFQNYPIYISRAYVGWKNDANWLTVIAGKQPGPFYTTDMFWDPNINPSGLVEQVKFHKLFAGDVTATESTQGGKSVVSVTQSPVASPWELTLVSGQFAFSDNNEDLRDGLNTDAFLFEEQLIFSYKFNKNVKFTLAPAYLFYNAATITSAINTQPFSQATDSLPAGIGETRNLSLIEIPGDISFKICGLSTKFLWDFSYNTNGAKRTRDIYQVNGEIETVKDAKGNVISTFRRSDHSSQDDMGFQVGIQLGQNAKPGDWSLLTTYRQVGLASVDPNLNCSDFALSRLNVKGWKFSLAYSLSSAVVGQVTYFLADNLRRDLIGGQATSGAKLADGNNLQLLTVDLNVKF